MVFLPLIALVLAALFTGAAIYISLVEHPVRLGLSDAAMLGQWQPSYSRALPIQAGLAVVGGVVGLVAWYQAGDWQYLAASIVLLANWPFTLLGIMPTNKRLQAMTPHDAGAESRTLLVKWGGLHNVRSILGSVATVLILWGLGGV
jgi:hypothetical protein